MCKQKVVQQDTQQCEEPSPHGKDDLVKLYISGIGTKTYATKFSCNAKLKEILSFISLQNLSFVFL